jgi:putative oxidoreductase
MAEFKKVNDIKELASLASSIWHEYWTCILTPEQIDYMVENFQSEKAIKNQIENENYTYYFIIKDGAKAGYFGISDKKEYLFLSKLYIKKEYRHQGLGKKAFEKIKELANDKPIRLTVNKYNTNTINAYKKWGFEIIDAVVTDIGSGFVMDDYIMGT